jgi:hypothetical protein
VNDFKKVAPEFVLRTIFTDPYRLVSITLRYVHFGACYSQAEQVVFHSRSSAAVTVRRENAPEE